MSKEQLFSEALALPEAERQLLVEELLSSFGSEMDPEVEQYWKIEVEARLQKLKDGSLQTVDGAQVIQEIRSLLKR